MNIYKLLRFLTQESTMSQGDKADGLSCIDELERVSAFGTIAKQMEGGHPYTPWPDVPINDRQYSQTNPYWKGGFTEAIICGYCGKTQANHDE